MFLVSIKSSKHRSFGTLAASHLGLPEDLIFWAAVLVSTCAVLAGASLAPGLIKISEALGEEQGTLARLVISIPALGVPVGAFALGAFARPEQHRLILLAALQVFAIAGGAGALFQTYGPVLMLRFVQGVAIGPMMVIAVGLLSRGPQPQIRIAMQSSTMIGATVIILLAGGVASALAWWLPFLLNLMPLAFLPLVARLPFDVFLPAHGAGAAARAVPRKQTGTGGLRIATCLAFLAMAAFYAVPTQASGHLSQLGISAPLAASGLIITSVVAAAFGSLAFRQLHDAMSVPALLAPAFFAIFTGYILLAYSPAWPPMIFGGTLIGFGFGVIFPTLNHWVSTSDMGLSAPRAIALVTAGFQLGQFYAPIAGAPALMHDEVGGVFLLYAILAFFGVVMVALNHAILMAETPTLHTEEA